METLTVFPAAAVWASPVKLTYRSPWQRCDQLRVSFWSFERIRTVGPVSVFWISMSFMLAEAPLLATPRALNYRYRTIV